MMNLFASCSRNNSSMRATGLLISGARAITKLVICWDELPRVAGGPRFHSPGSSPPFRWD